MKIGEEKNVEMVEFQMDLSKEEAKVLREYALKNIVNDDDTLISWSVNDILKKMTENLTQDDFKELIKDLDADKSVKKGTKNARSRKSTKE